jgi:hypothetical protein
VAAIGWQLVRHLSLPDLAGCYQSVKKPIFFPTSNSCSIISS